MISDDFDEIAFFARSFPRLLKKQPDKPSYVAIGWLALVNRLLIDLDSMMDDDQAAQFDVQRIDEHWGSLRIDWTLGGQTAMASDWSHQSHGNAAAASDRRSAIFVKVSERIDKSKRESTKMCMDCSGEAQVAKRNGMMLAMCDSCADWRRWPKDGSAE